jgi:hypothetical protein
LHLYRTILHRHPSLREALDGAGRTAFQMGRYLEAKRYLARALQGPGVDQEPKAGLEESRDRLSEATRLLLLYPSSRLSLNERSVRILADRKLAMARLAQCTQDRSQAPAKDSAAASAPAPAVASNPLQSLKSRFTGHPTAPTPNQAAAPPPVDPLQALTARWKQLPAKLKLRELEENSDLAQTQIQLIYDTELLTQQLCGAPAGDDDLLLKIAQAPNQVEEE